MGCYHYEVDFGGGSPTPFNQVTFSFAAIQALGGAPGDTWSIVTSTPIGHTDFVARELVDPGPSEYFLDAEYAGNDGSREYWTATGTRVGADPNTFVNIRWGTTGVSMAGLHIVDICSNPPAENTVGWKAAWS